MKGYITKIIESMNLFLGSKGETLVSMEDVAFVMDSDLSYEQDVCSIRLSRVLTLKEFDQKVAKTLLEGPSWIHANLIRSSESRDLLSIRFGASVGNPAPSINLSIERKTLTFIPE